MNLTQIESTLPNGFHDAELTKLSIDYLKGTARLEMRLCWAGPEDGPEVPRVRSGVLSLSRLEFCVMEPPDPRYRLFPGEALDVDGFETASVPKVASGLGDLLAVLPKDAFAYSFFVGNLNTFLHLAAHEADFAWNEAASVT